jgi:hypothetical protein
MMAVLAAALSFTRMDSAALFRNSALVQAFPVVAGVAFLTIQEGHLNLRYARYGPFFAWFTMMAYALESSHNRDAQTRRVAGPAKAQRGDDPGTGALGDR